MTHDDDKKPKSLGDKIAKAVYAIVDTPVTFVREKLIEPNQTKYNYYHRRFRRVPTIDQCDVKDPICRFEAHQQWKRDKMVDNQILKILRKRMTECMFYEGADHKWKCKKVREDYDENANNWFIRYGDLGTNTDVVDAYMKMKHRLIWERRHGQNKTKDLDS
ncbi:hypothetical protein ACJMK2_033938 [Sinanodonta woodiana]|uniref:NADH dehydrogenase [ubiquinone] 1 beta subcomplex subunit 10 n=1 Tax=Sinanodonta woodiana TaxID=1069815 RepID=A0ABD3WTI8_SINWO